MQIKQLLVNASMAILIAILFVLLILEKFHKENKTNETIETIIEERYEQGSGIIDDSTALVDRIDIFLGSTVHREHL